ncbi:MAG: 16S rRNA (uracil(1498)-N(3))-methyltransferase [Thermosynechococcus sp. Uc]|uniref:RsmE family RNA methyltransferase n=1 Tax=Thermosynechococcus sp. Uc TaxID=3034853 RepID=UPI001A081FE8|nr:16S rRNA (uracil(1498)-N(3))-methyltransferase [Thermosynechococcus sp. Uc]MDM7326796.1 16S rRNA (uracil(1498)-N(3))-methyltransferase [Thermosynechococcus sp. Uc]HIK25357.1 16S rRNA (uracil(1498)-N(3))-methyltransferase [Thermosynechococcus sp. M46_R2017_013]
MRSRQRLIVKAEQILEQGVTLTAEQWHYLYHVLRLKPGDELWILDGQGQRWLGEIQANTVKLLHPDCRETELATEIILCLALLKAANFEQVLQQATELGVKHILPIQTARSLLQPSPHKYQRWQRILQEAAEQSERLYVPTLSAPLSVAEMVQLTPRGYIASLTASQLLWDYLPQMDFSQPIYLAIGPEGGWTDSELEQVLAAGWQAFSLGQRTLRAVTAAIASLTLVSHYSERYRVIQQQH